MKSGSGNAAKPITSRGGRPLLKSKDAAKEPDLGVHGVLEKMFQKKSTEIGLSDLVES